MQKIEPTPELKRRVEDTKFIFFTFIGTLFLLIVFVPWYFSIKDYDMTLTHALLNLGTVILFGGLSGIFMLLYSVKILDYMPQTDAQISEFMYSMRNVKDDLFSEVPIDFEEEDSDELWDEYEDEIESVEDEVELIEEEVIQEPVTVEPPKQPSTTNAWSKGFANLNG